METEAREQLAAPVIAALNKMQNGANVHAVNKARSYLISYAKGAWWIDDPEKNQRLFDAHLKQCQEAVKSGDLSKLKYSMRGLF